MALSNKYISPSEKKKNAVFSRKSQFSCEKGHLQQYFTFQTMPTLYPHRKILK